MFLLPFFAYNLHGGSTSFCSTPNPALDSTLHSDMHSRVLHFQKPSVEGRRGWTQWPIIPATHHWLTNSGLVWLREDSVVETGGILTGKVSLWIKKQNKKKTLSHWCKWSPKGGMTVGSVVVSVTAPRQYIPYTSSIHSNIMTIKLATLFLEKHYTPSGWNVCVCVCVWESMWKWYLKISLCVWTSTMSDDSNTGE